MEILQTIGDFQITSEKIDNYKPWWFTPTGAIGFFGAMFWMFLNTFTIMGGEMPPEWGLGRILLIGISVILLFAPAAYYNDACGVAITLKGTRTNTLLTSKFVLSNDADRDAKKIKNVVDEYVKRAHQIDAEQKSKDASEKKLKQECCTRYNDVIQKVKTE
jgi:low affinity Fe/Cu permease